MTLSKVLIGVGLCAALVQAAGPVRVATVQAEKQAINKPRPMYPPAARQLRIAGDVEVDATVDEQGNVEKTEVVKGNVMLTSAAQMAAKNWTFKPFTEDGKPMKVIVRLTFAFSL
ncbi:MAG: energy transducer TonB [Bryobacteraceae bacterium]|jgi:TonB family protein